MSTDTQVNNDYYMYACYYIYSINGDTKIFDDSNSTFTLDDTGNGIMIIDWNVQDVKLPTFTQLKQITPAQIVTGKKWIEINRINRQIPKLMTILRDIYNRLGVDNPITLPIYQNDNDMQNYLITKF